ncbi:MAG TPA: hypothetical protein VFE33_28130 [Thermoanaerobaculia bacterium]|nr:hypothetical protein [Thermoanaerobaculia bacterium]
MPLQLAISRIAVGALGLLLATPALATLRFVSPLGVDGANSCTNVLTPCATLQHAVDVSGSGDSITVVAAVYDQRLSIVSKTNLTVNALGVTLRPDPTVLGPADVNQGSPCSGSSGRAVVLVRDSTGIVLNGLVIDGSAAFQAPSETHRLAGIFYRNASGAINGGGVIHLRTEPASSNQVAGLAILIQTGSPIPSPAPRVDISGVTVSDYQKSGIVFSGCDCAADGGPTGSVHTSTVTANPSDLVARNGIQVSFGAGGVLLQQNTVVDQRFTGDPSLGLGSAVLLASSRNDQVLQNTLRDANFGISNVGDLFCSPRAGENLSNEIRCNQILDNDYGLTIDNNTHIIKNNDFSGNSQFAILTRSYYPPEQSDADATFNWWGSPTGPTIASNPGGTGDPLDVRVAYRRFLVLPSICAEGDVLTVPTVSTLGLAALALLLAVAAVLRLRRAQGPDPEGPGRPQAVLPND